MDLFDYMRADQSWKGKAPLAARLRPRTLDEVVGQQHIIGKDKLLYRAIQADKLSSIIFSWTARNGQNDPCEGDREYDQCGVYADQCDCGRQKGYGRGCG